MPASDSNQIPAVLQLVSETGPQSILDIGVGWGKYGALFRVCLETGYQDISQRSNWRILIDGVEAFAPYIGRIQLSIYNEIFVATVEEVLPKLKSYDVIFMGDMIEHLPKDTGLRIIQQLLRKANQRLIISTPNGPYEQSAVLDNEFERHQSFWTVEDFVAIQPAEVYATKKSIIAVLSRLPIESGGRRWRVREFTRQPASEALKARFVYRLDRLRHKLSGGKR